MSSSLQLTSIHLRVPDVVGSVEFYTRRLGFFALRSASDGAELATTAGSETLLRLTKTGYPPAPRDAAGLFHSALLLPNRAVLAGWLRFAMAQGVKFAGFSDHGVSEAIYCSDPDGNGLEFYVDRAREAWPIVDGGLAMRTDPLDVQGLLAEPPMTTPALLAGARWGHLHLRVTDLERSEVFYRRALGLEVTQRSYPGARFLAADAYHHHIGLNTWGNPRLSQPAGAPGLAEAVFTVRGAAKETRLADPDGIALRLVKP